MFLVDRRTQGTSDFPELRDRAYAFQPQMEVRSELPFPHKPVIHAFEGSDYDETVARLHYADSSEYPTCHGAFAEWDVTVGRCHFVRTAWIGRGAVHHTRTTEHQNLMFTMWELRRTADGAAADAMLNPVEAAYLEWIGEQSGSWRQGREGAESAVQLLAHARLAADRMDPGIRSRHSSMRAAGRGKTCTGGHREPSRASSRLSCRAAIWLSQHSGRFKGCVRDARTAIQWTRHSPAGNHSQTTPSPSASRM